MSLPQTKKKAFVLPHVLIILLIIMVIVTVLSLFIPSGEFARTELGAIDPTRFSYIANTTPITLRSFLSAIPQGIVESASTIVSILVISGVLHVIEETGAIAAGLQTLARASKGKETLIMVLLTLVFGVMGVIGFGEGALPFLPMSVAVSVSLGYDRMVGVASNLLGVAVGFTTGAFNMFTTGICQTLAGLTMFSGWAFRLTEFVICFAVLAVYMVRYCGRIKRDPSRSVIPEYAENPGAELAADNAPRVPFTWQRIVTLCILLFGFIFQAVGAIGLGWSMLDVTGMYVGLLVLVVVVNWANPNKACVDFLKGTTTVIPAVIVIGVARAIYLLMAQAKIVDTIIHAIATVFDGKSPFVIIILLYLVVIAFNFFVVSASGKAFILFPMLKPLADILGINQQVVVTTFQLGDGFTNYLFPTAGALMAGLELGGVTYQQWVKFSWKIITLLVALGAVFSLVAQAIGLS